MKIKKALKSVVCILITFLIIFCIYNLYSWIFKGNLDINVNTSSTYYSGEAIEGTVSVRKHKNDKQVKSNLKIKLYNKDGKKVKNVKGKYAIEKGEKASISLDIPKDIETGRYTLKIVSTSGLNRDVAEVPVNIIQDTKSNVIISLDKGIYKPGDEINFRGLLISKKENKPVENDVSIYIYDGNNNKVYSNNAKTSEYGIVSGKFKLADEVNSGTYKIVISTKSQEVSKTFNVNPYITPKFETNIITDKDNYIVGETAQITVNGKYFFGEPVKGGDVKGTINEKEIAGITDEEGKFITSYVVDKAGKIDLKFNVTDSSNYMIEANKTISCGTDIFEIEVLPEFGNIIKNVDNEIYIFTKDASGKPIKTYSTVIIDNISKQVISDENGIGKFVITSDETKTLKQTSEQNIKINSEDMEKRKISKDISVSVDTNSGVLIKTDKVKYNAGDDINLSILKSVDSTSNVAYIYKNKELLKAVSFDDDSIDFNLENITGLIDIYVPTSKTVSRTATSISIFKDNVNGFSKKTIFIKPSQELNIDIQTSAEQYKPGDTLNVKFTTTDGKENKVDSALLVSILDEAVLSLAENDLTIDNIKLALQDIKLVDGVTAADLYANVLDNSSDNTLRAILLKQNTDNPDIINKIYTDNEKDTYLAKFIISCIALVILILVFATFKVKKFRNFLKTIIVPFINVSAIYIILQLYLADFMYDNISFLTYSVTYLINIVLAIVIYCLVLYKQKDLIFEMICNFGIIPGVFLIIGRLLCGLIAEYIWAINNSLYYDDVLFFIMAMLIGILVLAFVMLTVISRNRKLGRKLKIIYNILSCLAKAFMFWFAVVILCSITNEFGFLIVLVCYVLYRKIILRETKTKMEDGKIVLNINFSEIFGAFCGIIMIAIIIGIYILAVNMFDGLNISKKRKYFTDDISYIDSSSSTNISDHITFNDFNTGDITGSAIDGKGSGSSGIFNSIKNAFGGTFSKDVRGENNITNESISVEPNNTEEISNIEKNIETEENVRNVFLECLAFIPELVTENGTSELSTKISDNITTWNIQTIGNTKDGNIGYASSTFKVFKEFFVEFSLPTNSVVSDKTNIPVTLYNYTENELSIDINVKENDWCTIGNYDKKVSVPAKSTSMIYVPIEILKAGNNTLRVETKSGDISDIVEKTMKVNINGLEKQEVVSSGIIQKDYSQDMIFNESAIDGTKKVKVKLYPSAMTQIIENMENILKMPTGCFEQTSSSLYPDILVLEYLRNNNLANPELEEKALEYISAGYQKLLTYEVNGTRGGYSLYGKSPAEPVITAFGLMEMNELSKVYEIDQNVVNNMKEYLFDVQKIDGTFKYNSVYIGGASSTDDLAMNAYIVWALSEVCPEDSRLEKSIKYLKNKVDYISDTYTLGLIANILANTQDKQAKDIVNELSDKIKTTENGAYVESSIRDYYGTRGKYQNIQATSLMSIALTKLKTNNNTNELLMNYIISSKDARGTWGTTQSTILALKAINAYSKNSELKNQTITVKLNNEEKKIDVKEDSLDVYEFEFENPSNENHISIGLKNGKITYEIIKEYYKDYKEVEFEAGISSVKKVMLEQSITQNAKVNDEITQTISIKNNYGNITNGLLQINIPQGASVIEDVLLQLQYEGKIEKYEYNYEKINIYLRDFKENDEISISVKYRALYPENITGGAVRFFDYYNPDVEAILGPVNIKVSE